VAFGFKLKEAFDGWKERNRKEQLDDSNLGSLKFSINEDSFQEAFKEEQIWSSSLSGLDILSFESSIVSAGSFSILFDTKLAYRMIDNYGKEQHHLITYISIDGFRCGALYGDIKASWTNQSLNECEFVLLSKVRVIDWDRDDPEWFVAFDKERYECTEWCTLNILLVRRRGNFVERLAVGQMHVDAWARVGPQTKFIHLV
jgi:hypothetical protein